jgi:hypothetical protein
MPTKSRSKEDKAPTRSRKGPAEIGAKKKYRGQAKSARGQQAQYDHDRPDRGGPQGRKDKDFQRKR